MASLESALVDLLIEIKKMAQVAEEVAIANAIGDESDATAIDRLMDLLIEVRQLARKAKAFAIADRVRDRLAELGIALEDHPQGTIWKKKDS